MTTKTKRVIHYPNICAHAKALGVSREHLYRVLTGQRESDDLMQRYKIVASGGEAPPASVRNRVWRPIDTAPKDSSYILLAGPSGYTTTPLRVVVCRWDAEYRPLQPWVNHANDSFMDGGEEPCYWMPLPKPPTDKP